MLNFFYFLTLYAGERNFGDTEGLTQNFKNILTLPTNNLNLFSKQGVV